MEKRFLDEETLILDAFRLGVRIFESGFRPTFIVGLWRGGSTVGIYVQECLQTLGVQTDHIALRTSYQGQEHYFSQVASPDPRIRVHGTQYLLENLNTDDGLLLVDDVFSTGLSVQAVLNRLRHNLKRNMPTDIRIAALWKRPSFNKTGLEPDYFLHETEDWLVFPYEMRDLSAEEIRQYKPWLHRIMHARSTEENTINRLHY
ncbi:MAG: hypoxanthine phosphoribosyltransferase [Thiothrix sp.]|nr:hypoxanthine phosphoribosyltransferase [Thiothrix sp.]HPQ94718.1 phosphoribosyltransferase family protein [Thiolinea sp.]